MLKRLKRFFIWILSLIIITLPCSAKNLVNITYNGEEVIDLEKEAKQINNSILLPLRTISQYLGYTINWNQTSRQIEIIDGNTKITLFVGNNRAQINGEEVQLSAPARMIEGTTYVPLRFVGEALNLTVDWDGKTQTVKLEDKYTLDKEKKQLLVRTQNGKQVLSEVATLQNEEMTLSIGVDYTTTKNGSEIVTVSEAIQGALTGSTSTDFYIKNGKIIDKIERPFHYINEDGIAYFEDKIALCYGTDLRIYNDKTGELIERYNLENYQEGLTLDLMKIGKNYAMGRHEHTIHIVDFETGKVTKVLDLIPVEDQGFVFQSDMFLATDDLKLVWETDTALVFKYYSITDDVEKTVACQLGK